MQMPCHCCHVVKRIPMMVPHGTGGKGDVDCITGHCPPLIGKATEAGIMGPTYIRRESRLAVLYVEYR